MKTATAIGELIDACVDDERMLRHEIRFVGAGRREVLEGLADDRARFVQQLEAIAPRANAGSRDGSWIELGRELGRAVPERLGVSTEGDAVLACLRSCRRAEALFDDALGLPWPESTRATLVAQRSGFGAAHHALVTIEF